MDVTTQQVMGSPLVHDPQTQRPFTTPFRNLFPPPPSVWLSSYVRVTVSSSKYAVLMHTRPRQRFTECSISRVSFPAMCRLAAGSNKKVCV